MLLMMMTADPLLSVGGGCPRAGPLDQWGLGDHPVRGCRRAASSRASLLCQATGTSPTTAPVARHTVLPSCPFGGRPPKIGWRRTPRQRGFFTQHPASPGGLFRASTAQPPPRGEFPAGLDGTPPGLPSWCSSSCLAPSHQGRPFPEGGLHKAPHGALAFSCWF